MEKKVFRKPKLTNEELQSVKDYLKENNMTVAELAKHLNVSTTTLRVALSGQTNCPKLNNFYSLVVYNKGVLTDNV